MKFALTLISILLISCSHPSSKVTIIVPEKPIDTSKYVVFKFDISRDDHLFKSVDKPGNLSASEIAKIETIISRKANEYNKREKAFQDSINKKFYGKEPVNSVKFDNLIHQPEKYYKQFLAIINSKGEKEVWVSCFCDKQDNAYWKTEWVGVKDGGSCYFKIKINLTNNTVSGFYVNGIA
jgi:hypothetical protein